MTITRAAGKAAAAAASEKMRRIAAAVAAARDGRVGRRCRRVVRRVRMVRKAALVMGRVPNVEGRKAIDRSLLRDKRRRVGKARTIVMAIAAEEVTPVVGATLTAIVV